MNFIHFDLGTLSGAKVVQITLNGNAANVRLMDNTNFNSYRNGGSHNYIGGLIKQSPVRLSTSHSDHWHVAVDMQGLSGSTKASVRVL